MAFFKNYTAPILAGLLSASCQSSTDKPLSELKEEIRLAEHDFAKMAVEKGIAEAFYYYADSTAVIKRQNDTLIRGKDGIRNFYSADHYKTASVQWAPDFIDVSEKGDLAYTYGKYTWGFPDSTGKINEFKGVFHTVWKRQADGSWKYVWD